MSTISVEALSQTRHESFQVIDAPVRENTAPGNKSIFFSGSVKSSMDRDWQVELTKSLSHLPVTVFNPRRVGIAEVIQCHTNIIQPDWDNSWVEDIQDLRFRHQVNWELDHMKDADLVIVYFAAKGLSAVTLLEFGLCVAKMEGRKGTMLVCCEPKYERRGNVQVVCAKYDIKLMEGLDGVEDIVKEVLDL